MPRFELRSVVSGLTVTVTDDGYNAGNVKRPAGGRQHIERMLEKAVPFGDGEIPVWYPLERFAPWSAGGATYQPSSVMRQRPAWGKAQDEAHAALKPKAEKAVAKANRIAAAKISNEVEAAAEAKAKPMRESAAAPRRRRAASASAGGEA